MAIYFITSLTIHLYYTLLLYLLLRKAIIGILRFYVFFLALPDLLCCFFLQLLYLLLRLLEVLLCSLGSIHFLFDHAVLLLFAGLQLLEPEYLLILFLKVSLGFLHVLLGLQLALFVALDCLVFLLLLIGGLVRLLLHLERWSLFLLGFARLLLNSDGIGRSLRLNLGLLWLSRRCLLACTTTLPLLKRVRHGGLPRDLARVGQDVTTVHFSLAIELLVLYQVVFLSFLTCRICLF